MGKKKNVNKKNKIEENIDLEVVEGEKVKEDKNIKKNNKKVERVREYREPSAFESELMHVVMVAGIIIVIFCVFYWITFFITNKDNKKEDEGNTNEVSVSYENIVLGRSFSMGDGEYYVLYYDKNNEEISSTYSSLVSGYGAGVDSVPLYVVNMGDALNSFAVSDSGNNAAKDASELKINGPTLIKFNGGAISEYIEGEEGITSKLSVK